MRKATKKRAAGKPPQSSSIVQRSMVVEFQVGRVDGESLEVYHGTPALSHSKLMDFMPPWGRPSLFYRRHAMKDKKVTKTETEEMLIGNAADCLILEGEEAYARRYAVMPHFGSPGTQFYYVRLAGWKKDHPGVIGLEAAQDKLNRALREAVLRDQVARALVEESAKQVTWRLATPQFYVQARTDIFIDAASARIATLIPGVEEGEPLGADLKTCGTLNPEGRGAFFRNAQDFDYAGQQAWYSEVISPIIQRPLRWFPFVAVEKDKPHECAVVTLDPEDVSLAAERISAELHYLAVCAQTGVWPEAGAAGVRQVSFKPWHRAAQRDYLESTQAAAERLPQLTPGERSA